MSSCMDWNWCVGWTTGNRVWLRGAMDRTLVRCTNENCSQYDKVKSISPLYLGNGVYQRLTPVCSSCDGKRDMAIVSVVGAKSD